jgi:hypothetical protein
MFFCIGRGCLDWAKIYPWTSPQDNLAEETGIQAHFDCARIVHFDGVGISRAADTP